MNRKEFLKSASLAAGGILVSPVVSCERKKSSESGAHSGVNSRNLSAAVSALEWVDAAAVYRTAPGF